MIDYAIRGSIDAKELDRFFQNWKSPPLLKIKRKLLKGIIADTDRSFFETFSAISHNISVLR